MKTSTEAVEVGTAVVGVQAERRTCHSGEDLPAAWAPDSQTIVFAAATNRNRAAFESVPTQLFEVAVGGGEPRTTTVCRKGSDAYGSDWELSVSDR